MTVSCVVESVGAGESVEPEEPELFFFTVGVVVVGVVKAGASTLAGAEHLSQLLLFLIIASRACFSLTVLKIKYPWIPFEIMARTNTAIKIIFKSLFFVMLFKVRFSNGEFMLFSFQLLFLSV